MSLTEGEDSVCVPWMLKTQDEEDTTKPPLSINAQLLASGLCFFAVSVAFNSYGAASSFASFVDPSVPPEVLSNQQHLLLRIAAGVCGGVLLVVVIFMMASLSSPDNPLLGVQHPYFVGNVVTAVAWLILGVSSTAENRAKWLGIASNGLSTSPAHLDVLAV